MNEVEKTYEYEIPAENLPLLKKKLEQVNKRARKLGVPELELELGDTYPKAFGSTIWEDDPEGAYYIDFLRFNLTGEAPKYDGWQFVATVDHPEDDDNAPNILSKVPTYEGTLPEKYRYTDRLLCEHCETRRVRRETFLIEHEDGTIKQVGRQCLRDFLGHQTPEFVARLYATIRSAIEEASKTHESGGWLRVDPLYETFNVVTYAATAVRLYGFMPTKFDGYATANRVFDVLNASDKYLKDTDPTKAKIKELRHSVTEEDREKAQAAIDWAKNQGDSNNDYLFNLYAAACQKHIKSKHFGILASLPRAYDRAMGLLEEKEREESEHQRHKRLSKHIGNVKDRLDFGEVEVIFLMELESQFGITFLYKFEDRDGNIIVWFSTRNKKIEEGDRVTLTGTVKKHDEYKGVAQTTITRGKVEKVGE